MDPFVLKVYKSALPSKGEVVRISPEAQQALNEVLRETGLSARAVVSQMILFCAERCIVKEV